MKIDIFRLRVLGSLSGARGYLVEIAMAVPALQQQAHDRVLVEARQANWDESDYDCASQEVDALFEHTMPRVLTRSFLVYLHSVIEHNLALIARDVRERLAITLKPNEVNGSVVDRTRVYLTKVAGIQVSDLPGWSALRDVAKVRDVIVHRGCELGEDPSERERLRQLAQRFPGLLGASRGWDESTSELDFNEAFCSIAVDQAYGLFEQLLARTRSIPGAA